MLFDTSFADVFHGFHWSLKWSCFGQLGGMDVLGKWPGEMGKSSTNHGSNGSFSLANSKKIAANPSFTRVFSMVLTCWQSCVKHESFWVLWLHFSACTEASISIGRQRCSMVSWKLGRMAPFFFWDGKTLVSPSLSLKMSVSQRIKWIKSPPRGMLKSTKSLWSWCMKQCFPTRCAPTQLWVLGCFQANLQARCAFWGSKSYSPGICRGWNVCPPNNLYPGSFEFLFADDQPQFHVFHIHRSCTWVICVK